MTARFRPLRFIAYALVACVICGAAIAAWLYVDAHRDRDTWLASRHGQLTQATVETDQPGPGLLADRVQLRSDSGLVVTVRVLRPAVQSRPLPVLLLLGGHQTGADAVDLFRSVENFIIVALDYPYDGPRRTRGFLQTASTIPAIRRAFLDAAPAISLTADWVLQQPWTEAERLALAGVSLGVPFAATAAARDRRFRLLLLVHGVASNEAWIRHDLARRADLGPLLAPAAMVLNWVVYGPLHDTATHVAEVAPRNVIIVGASADERSPPGQTEALFAAAGEPKKLLWTRGRHVQPGRREIIDELLAIVRRELPAL